MVKYIVRLDDAHPRFDRERWLRIEVILQKHGIKPIVAIIPDNQDATICATELPDETFWYRAINWQAAGWVVGLHGLRHALHFAPGSSILPISKNSEFSGLKKGDQLRMLNDGIEILEKKGLRPTVFVAPAHGFDSSTILALYEANRPLILSDGFGFRPYKDKQLKIIPQQLWRGRDMWFGTWTICLHPSNMSDSDFFMFERFAAKNNNRFCSVSELKFVQKTFVDSIAEYFWKAIFLLKQHINSRLKTTN